MTSRTTPLFVIEGQAAAAAQLSDEALMRLLCSGERRALEMLGQRHLHRVASPNEYIGLARTDLDRMHIILNQAATRDRSNRLLAATIFGISGGAMIAGSLAEFVVQRNNPDPTTHWMAAGSSGVAGLGLGIAGLATGLIHSDWGRRSDAPRDELLK